MSRRSKIAPKKPAMVIIVSVFISSLCTGHALSRSRIYRFPEMIEIVESWMERFGPDVDKQQP
jgi:hypothetical protein